MITDLLFKNAPKGWRVDSTKNVYVNDLIQLYEDTLELGARGKKVYIRGIRRNYSSIVPFISRTQILAIKSYRHIVDSVQIEVPSGYIENGESPQYAAIRELKEETGYEAKSIVSIGSYTLDYSMFEQTGNIFVAYDLIKEGEQTLGNMERIELTILSINEISRLLFEGKIINAASIVALYKAIDYHQRSQYLK
jgi:ADP-ribose pyrophosphatase